MEIADLDFDISPCKKCKSTNLSFEEDGPEARVVCLDCGNTGPWREMEESYSTDSEGFEDCWYTSAEANAAMSWNTENEVD